jgi:hypothetical protein
VEEPSGIEEELTFVRVGLKIWWWPWGIGWDTKGSRRGDRSSLVGCSCTNDYEVTRIESVLFTTHSGIDGFGFKLGN